MNSNNGSSRLTLHQLILDSDELGGSIDISLTVDPGTVHALFGDDPQLLSQILQLISGARQLRGGKIFFDGLQYTRISPRKAVRMGIEIIDRSPKGFLNLTVLENIFSERSTGAFGHFSRKRHQKALAEDFFSKLSLDIPLQEKLGQLTPAEQKIVEIARSVLASPRLLLIEDSVLKDIQESLRAGTIDKLMYIFTIMVKGGASILISSGDMDRIFSFADVVTVITCGTIQKTVSVNDIDKFQLVHMAYEFIVSRKELEKNNFELYYYKQIYQEVIDSLIFPLLVTDTKRRILIYNNEARSRYFPHEEDPVMRLVSDVLDISEVKIDEIEQELLEFPASKIYSLEKVFPDARIYISPIRDSYGSFMGMLYIFSREQDPLPLENEFLAHTKKLDMEYRINEIIHEVKNPLGIIINFLRLVKQEDSLESIGSITLSIEKEVERINRLLNKLTKQKRSLTIGKQKVTAIPLMFNEIASFLHPVMVERGIELRIQQTGDMYLRYDPDLVRQVVLNMMLNAVEAMAGGGILTIEAEAEDSGDARWLLIRIGDNGPGIAPENLERIFEPFFTTKQEGNSSGIGLSICQEIIENFKGQIEVDSKLGEGTVFTIKLPD